jgi:hypothetical protein
MNIKHERNVAMKKAYAFARSGNKTWAQLWVDRAAQFFPVHPVQLAHANKLLKQAKEGN